MPEHLDSGPPPFPTSVSLTNGTEKNIDYSEPKLSDDDEDALLKDTSGSFADWVTSFIRRVIQLLENLPEEGVNGSPGGATEGSMIIIISLFVTLISSKVQVVDAVAGACSQICVHLSEPLYDLVLNMVFDYTSTNVRSNAVRAIHQLIQCIANADPVKTLAMFLPFCSQNIRTELENGASSLRTTSASSPLPSDATLHWSLYFPYPPSF
jgi:proteasome activator subunit 4